LRRLLANASTISVNFFFVSDGCRPQLKPDALFQQFKTAANSKHFKKEYNFGLLLAAANFPTHLCCGFWPPVRFATVDYAAN
jgi:hypothetical protein